MTELTDEAVKALPDEIQVWRSTDTLDHIGTWSTTRYPPEAVTYVPKSDAAAAVALMVAQAATQADPWDGPVTKNKIVDAQAIAAQQIKARIRALAPADGLALLQELREERDRFEAALGRACQVGGTTYLVERAEKSEAERDRLAAANAVLDAKVAGLRDFIDDFAKAKIDALRYSPPCGSSPEDEPDPVVDAKTVWAWQADAKAALATQEAGTC